MSHAVRMLRVLASAVLLLALGACSGSSGTGDTVELDATESTASSPATTSSAPSETPNTAAPEADRTPVVEGPQGLTAEQQAALDGYLAYVVTIDRLARTNDLEGSGVLDTTTGAIQEGVRAYTAESLRVGRTSDGPPLRVRALAVDVAGDTATMPVCFDQSFWTDVVGGVPTPAPGLLAFDVTVVRQGDRWLVSSVVDADITRCT